MRSAMGNYEGIINDSDDWPDIPGLYFLVPGLMKATEPAGIIA
ncbi:hypothetical protein [Parasphingorhabdus sp. NYA22]